MGKGGGRAPAAPDPVATAQAQAQANAEAVQKSAEVNQINQVTPYGSTNWTGTIGEPDRTQTTTLAAPQQRQLGYQNLVADILGQQATTRAGNIQSAPFTLDGLPSASIDDFSADRQRAEDSAYDSFTRRMDPRFERDEDSLRTRLQNQGITEGSEAYKREIEQFGQLKDDAYLSAGDAAFRSGAAEQSRLYDLARDQRSNALNENIQSRTQDINELSAILQGTPALQSPQGSQPAQYQVAPADVQGAIYNNYNNQVNAANQRQANNTSKMGGLGQLGSAGASIYALSDEGVKENIKPMGKENGHNVYEFNYIGKPDNRFIGVIAQEVLETDPQAVREIGGHLAVNYDAIGVKMREVI